MKKTKQRLSLKKEYVRILNAKDLVPAQGGYYTQSSLPSCEQFPDCE